MGDEDILARSFEAYFSKDRDIRLVRDADFFILLVTDSVTINQLDELYHAFTAHKPMYLVIKHGADEGNIAIAYPWRQIYRYRDDAALELIGEEIKKESRKATAT